MLKTRKSLFAIRGTSSPLLLFIKCLLLISIFFFNLAYSHSTEIHSPQSAKNSINNYNDDDDSQNKNNLHINYNGAGRPTPLSSAYSLKNSRQFSQYSVDPSTIASIQSHSYKEGELRSIRDWVVADLILVSSIDGSLHALDRQTGLKLWEIPGDKPLVQVSTSESLKSRFTQKFSSQSGCEDCDMICIVEPVGEGTLYYFTPITGLQQFPITIKELVMQSPFSLRGDDKIYIGSHSTTLYSIESSTGKILKAYGSGQSTFAQPECHTKRPFNDDDDESADDEEDYSFAGSEESGSFMIGRTDYKLEIHGKNENIWNVTYSVWGPNNIDSDLKAQHVKPLDNLYVTPLYDNSILALTTDGRRKPARWVGHIPSTAVNVFDVFRSQKVPTDSTLMLLPQPRFYTHANNDNNFLLHSTFIQQTDNGQWFAMSGFNFPSLVQSAPLSTWSEQKQVNYDTYEEFLHAIAGVHVNLGNTNNVDKIHSQIASSSGPLGIDAPSSFRAGYNSPKIQYQYDYENQVFRPSSEISRSSPPNPLPPTPPQPPVDSISKSRILNGLLRVVENALAFGVFFIFLILAGRYGWLNQVSGLAEFTSRLQPQQISLEHISSSDEKSDALERSIDITDHLSDIELPDSSTLSNGTITPKMMMTDTETVSSPMTPSTPTDSLSPRSIDIKSPQSSKKVEILEPEKPPAASPNAATSGSVVKKRKRGSRGGRKNNLAKKKEREEQVLLEQANNAGAATSTDEAATTDTSPAPPSGLPSGSLLDVSKDVIGYGSHGTVVLKGSFENREVAVKRMLLDFYEVASQEVSLLQESDDHPNVIRYFCKQVNDRFLYIALELCPGTLEDLIEKPEKFSELNSALTTSEIFYQIASGVHHLHCLKIVHRDLKPQNILVAPPKVVMKKDPSSKETVGPVRMLISDFGLCKKLEGDQSSFRATTANAAGTSGWRAPELLIDEQDSVYNHTILQEAYPTGSSSEPLVIDSLSNRRATRAIDIFSLGCVFYYILSKGIHPFGDKYLREANIVQGNYSLDCLEDYSQPDMVESRDLIERMISRDPRQRPDAKQVLKHPLFWSQEKRLDFLLKASDRFDIESRDPPSELLLQLEANAPKVVGDDWHSKLQQEFIDNLGKYRKYHGDRILDLLRAMRNKSHHFNDLPAAVRELMEPYPQGYLGYFTTKFPFLLMTIYYVVKNSLANEPMFKSFF